MNTINILNLYKGNEDMINVMSSFFAVFKGFLRGLLVAALMGSVCLTFCGCGNEPQMILEENSESEALAENCAVEGNTEMNSNQGSLAQNTIGTQNSAGNNNLDVAGWGFEGTNENVSVVSIYVCGAVQFPGVYSVDEGSRVIDAISAAGGFTENACPEALNLSEKVTDEMKVYIPTNEEIAEIVDSKNITGLYEYNGGTGKTNDYAVSDETSKVNINTADKSKLMTIKGIGETRAESIIVYREQHGAFSRVEDIMNVSGIGQASFEKIKDEITVQ